MPLPMLARTSWRSQDFSTLPGLSSPLFSFSSSATTWLDVTAKMKFSGSPAPFRPFDMLPTPGITAPPSFVPNFAAIREPPPTPAAFICWPCVTCSQCAAAITASFVADDATLSACSLICSADRPIPSPLLVVPHGRCPLRGPNRAQPYPALPAPPGHRMSSTDLGGQTLDRPPALPAGVEEAVMHPALAALPELDLIGPHQVAAPLLGPMRIVVAQAAEHLLEAPIELIALNRPALR